MSVTNIKGGLQVDGVPVGNLAISGKVFYVDGSIGVNDNAGAGSAAVPFDTGAYALAQCLANRGDAIIIGLGHDQTVATLLALNTVAGVTFIDTRYGVCWTTEGVGSFNAGHAPRMVKRAASLLPATTNLTIFNVVGACRITDIWGLVEVIIANTACLLKISAVSTGLTAVDLCADSASLAQAAVGTVYSITGTVANAGILSANQARIAQAGALIVHTGVIRITTSGSPATGTVSWHCLYTPLTPGSYIIAA